MKKYFLFLFVLILITVNAQVPTEADTKIRSAIEAKKIWDFAQTVLDSSGFLTARSVTFEDFALQGNCEHLISYKKLDNQIFPLEEYTLYEVVLNRYVIQCGDKWIHSRGSHESGSNSELFLVAIDQRTFQVVYISGNFFQSRISRYFNLHNEVELLNYLQLKLFAYGVSSVRAIGRNKYELFSELLKKKIIVVIDEADKDLVSVVVE